MWLVLIQSLEIASRVEYYIHTTTEEGDALEEIIGANDTENLQMARDDSRSSVCMYYFFNPHKRHPVYEDKPDHDCWAAPSHTEKWLIQKGSWRSWVPEKTPGIEDLGSLFPVL